MDGQHKNSVYYSYKEEPDSLAIMHSSLLVRIIAKVPGMRMNMIERINHILNILMWSLIGGFIGHGIYMYWDYKRHPELYAMESSPWYTGVLLYGGVTFVLVLLIVLIRCIIRKRSHE